MSFVKKYLSNIEHTGKIIGVFEKNGFQVRDMDHYQGVMMDLLNVLSGATGKKRGRKPKNALASAVAPIGGKKRGRPAKKKRGRPAGVKSTKPYTGKKRGRKPKVVAPVTAE